MTSIKGSNILDLTSAEKDKKLITTIISSSSTQLQSQSHGDTDWNQTTLRLEWTCCRKRSQFWYFDRRSSRSLASIRQIRSSASTDNRCRKYTARLFGMYRWNTSQMFLNMGHQASLYTPKEHQIFKSKTNFARYPSVRKIFSLMGCLSYLFFFYKKYFDYVWLLTTQNQYTNLVTIGVTECETDLVSGVGLWRAAGLYDHSVWTALCSHLQLQWVNFWIAIN